MRVLIATYDGYSHVHQAVPIVRRLVLHGHSVHWLVAGRYRSIVEWSGATLVPTVHSPDHEGISSRQFDEWVHLFAEEAPQQVLDVQRAVLDTGANVLLVDPTITGITRLDDTDDLTIAMLGCIPLLHVPSEVDLVLQGTFPEIEFPTTECRVPVFFVGPLLPPPFPAEQPPDAAIDQWSARFSPDKPMIVVTHGTLATDLDALARPVTEALADLPVTCLVQAPMRSTGWPGNVITAPWIPFHYTLPSAACVVSNGGYLGAQWCAAAGVPMVVIGSTEDKPAVGERVALAGFGINLCNRPLSPGIIRDAVLAATTQAAYRERARHFSQRYRLYDSGTVAVQILESWMAKLIPNKVEESDAA